MNTKVDDGFLTDFDDFLLDFLGRFGHNFLHPRRVDAAVLHQQVQREAGYFAAHRVEARNNDGFRSIVHNHFHARGRFQGPDVAPFTANDLTLNIVALDVEHRYAVLDGVLRSRALDRFEHNLFGVLGSCELGLRYRVLDKRVSLELGLVFERFHELLTGLGGSEVCHGFELALHGLELGFGFLFLLL